MAFQVRFVINGDTSDAAPTSQLDYPPPMGSVVSLDELGVFTVSGNPEWYFVTMPFPGVSQFVVQRVDVPLSSS